jgi:hypothetical protein
MCRSLWRGAPNGPGCNCRSRHAIDLTWRWMKPGGQRDWTDFQVRGRYRFNVFGPRRWTFIRQKACQQALSIS